MLYMPERSPFSFSSRLPGGTLKSPRASAASRMRSLRRAILWVFSSSCRTCCRFQTRSVSLSRNDRSTCAIITLCVINVKRYAWRATKLGLVGSRQANERARDRGSLVLIVGAKAHQVPLPPSSQVITTDDGPKGQALQGSLETGPHSVDHYALRRQGPAHGTAGNSRREAHRQTGRDTRGRHKEGTGWGLRPFWRRKEEPGQDPDTRGASYRERSD